MRVWIDVQLMLAFYHFYGDPDMLDAVLSRARPVVEARGTQNKRQTFIPSSATRGRC